MGELKRDDWIVGGLALLVVIDLLFLPWIDLGVSAGPYSASYTSSGAGAPDGWLGVLGVVGAVAVIADLLIERMSPQTTLPNFGGSRTVTRFRLAVLVAAFVVLKFLFHLHFSWLGIGFWGAVVLSGLLVFATRRASQDRPILAS